MIIANDEEESEGNTNGDADLTDSDSDGEGGGKWSDRALMNKYGNITAIEIEEYKGYCIHRIRARCLHSPFHPIPPFQVRQRRGRLVAVERNSISG